MRVIRHYEHGGPEVLRLEEVDTPTPGPGEVLIRAEAIGVNFADVQKRQGVPMGGPARLPGAPGGDVAGTIEAIGEGVTTAKVGDRVVAGIRDNAYADYVVSPANHLFFIPAGVNAAEATALPSPGQTAYHALQSAGQLKPGDTVLIDAAAGGVGHLAVQIAKAMGAGTVIATAGSQAKLDFVKSLGADHAFNYTQDDWTDKVLEVTGGRGVDVLLETVGNDILTQSIGVVATFGRLVFYGAAGAATGSGIPPINVLSLIDMKAVTGFSLYAIMFKKPDVFAAGQADLIDMVTSGRVKPIIHAELPLEDAAKAHELMEARTQLGKVVLIP